MQIRAPCRYHNNYINLVYEMIEITDGKMCFRFDGCQKICIQQAPSGLETEFKTLFTRGSIRFLCDIALEFDNRIQELYSRRLQRKIELKKSGTQSLRFLKDPDASDPNWKIAPVPKKLINRQLDLGDVSPTNIEHFERALNCKVQGIQVDFDDGHCPTWKNQIIGLHNVYKAVHNQLPNTPTINESPILMLRPRAWNMTEHNITVNGKTLAGPIVDFALLMYHNAHILIRNGCGPFFYLSKVEGASEARLWNEIFVWSQSKLNIRQNTIKACVLIENILSSFEMTEILYQLRNHSLGLNCGIWDYAASFICKFGMDPNFVLPDRNKYVNMQRHFLKKYLQLVVQTCHARGAHATGGMNARILPSVGNHMELFEVVKKAMQAKHMEIIDGIDGFMVYDTRLVPYMNEMWRTESPDTPNQIDLELPLITIDEADLLQMPEGGVTNYGLNHNVAVAVLFILNWLEGNGQFIYKNLVEDSATAEISRSQIWQWIKHKTIIEDTTIMVTSELVKQLADNFVQQRLTNNKCPLFRQKLLDAEALFMKIVTLDDFPDFITTYLNDNYVFQAYHDCRTIESKSKL